MTKTLLSRREFEASRRFIEKTARPLEIARFRHAFDGASDNSVFDALKKYQNTDGGFGHALEPDLRAPESSALCTSIAFQVLRSIHAPSDEAIVSTGIAYLLDTLDIQKGYWRVIPSSAGENPHAPWWNQTGREKEFESFSLNPTAELLGYLYDYLGKSHREILSPVSEQVVRHLSGLEKIEMHDLLCCLRLLETKTLPLDIDRPVRQKLLQLIDATLTTDPAQWKEYNLRPLQVVDHPGSPFLAGRAESVAANLEYEISTQKEDGSWTITWTWGDAYPNEWILAAREWSGILTLDKLLLLKRFHSIQGIE
jgi:hypothetical protein